MKSLFLSFVVTILSLKSYSYPMGTTLIELLNNSKWIVEYKIINVTKDYIDIQITETFKGDSLRIMNVNQYQGTPCAFRFDEYRVGQMGIMFLQINPYSGRTEVMGSANEGELIYKNGNFNKSLDSLLLKQSGDFIDFNYLKEDVRNGLKEYFLNRDKLEALLFEGKIKSYSTKNPYVKRIIKDMQVNIHLLKKK